MNEPVETVKVSSRGRSVTIIYKTGKKWVESLDDCLRVFHDYERAKNEYLLRLWYMLHVYTNLNDDEVEKIMKTVKERLKSKPEIP